MKPEDFNSYSYPTATEQSFIQRVYQWMAVGLALTGTVAYSVSTNVGLLQALSGGAFLVLMLVELGIVFWLTASINKLSPAAALGGFLVYSALNGVTLSFIFVAYTQASIASTFFITAASFAGISLFGWTTKTDLTSLRGFFMMALIGFLIASVVNIFLSSPVFYWILTYAGIALFIGLTAYDTQRLKEIHRSGGATEQLAILGALKLYLDFINLFLLLLRLFGRRR
jgi:uncharacterized protein